MSDVIEQQQIDRLLCLPAGGDLWQLRVARLSEWLDLEAEDDRAVDAYVAASQGTGRIGMGEPREADRGLAPAAFEALLSLAKDLRPSERPSRVELEDAEVYAVLAPALSQCGIECALVAHVELLDVPIANMRREITGMEPYVPLYAGIAAPQLKSLAEAMALFHERRPWLWLSSIDFLQVEAPALGALPAWCSVQGGTGEQQGLLLVRTREDLTRFYDSTLTQDEARGRESWSVGSAAADEMAGADVKRWKSDALPFLEDGDLPLVAHYAGESGFQPVSAQDLAWFEAVLRAISLATEDELDSGRWSRAVTTAAGETTVTLALPALLDPAAAMVAGEDAREQRHEWRGERTMLDMAQVMEGREFAEPSEAQAFLREQMAARKVEHRAPETPRERAADLVFEANGYDGRKRSALARRALAEWADCADAWVILAEEMPDDDLALERYREGVEAAERALGPEVFAENAGHFWSLIETRPYMRARTGMADVLLASGEVDAAFAHLRDLLRLDDGDHQALRYVFVPALLENARFTEAREVLDSFADDGSPTMAWSRLLVEFAEHGDGPATQAALAEARRCNPHVAKYLAGSSPLPDREPPTARPGSDDEGRQVALELLPAYEAVEDVLDWLRESRKQAKKEGKAKRRKH